MEPDQFAGHPDNVPYIVAIVVMTLLGAVMIMGLAMLRPGESLATIVGQVSTILLPTTMALLAFLQSSTTHKSVNSRMTEMMALIKQASFAEGVKSAEALIILPGAVPPLSAATAIHSGDPVTIKKDT